MSENWKPIEYKFILLGDSSVGKSAIFNRLYKNKFISNSVATIGTEKCRIQFDKLEVNKKEKIRCNFDITLFDTAGQERYRSITKSYFRDSQGIILIYSIVDEKSFEHVQNWLESIKESLSDWKKSGYMIMLLGNKLDIVEQNMESRQVLVEEAQRICLEEEIYYGGECSAKTFDEEQMREIFEKFVKKIYMKLKEDKEEKGQKAKNINIQKNKKKKVGCCLSEL